jgi:hypothetical protein
MVGFSEQAWRTCTPTKGGSNARSYSERSAWDNACTPGGTPSPCIVDDINLSTITFTQGIKITGPTDDEQTGYSVSWVGDVNGDGIDDFIIGAPYFVNGATNGISYLIYGAEEIRNIDLSEPLGNKGITIIGPTGVAANSGWSVSGAGDASGGGKGDIIIGAPNAGAGRSYIIFGENLPAAPGSITLSDGFSEGVTIIGDPTYSSGKAGYSVSSAGTVNNDLYDDVIIGAPNAGDGRSYIIFGGPVLVSGLTMFLSDGFLDGVTIIGDSTYSLGKAGYSVSGAGDLNNDSYDDVIIGAPSAGDGRSYIIFGGPLTSGVMIQLSDGFSEGFTIIGATSSTEAAGWSVSGAGDVDGDGKTDVIIGAPQASTAAGKSYIIYGKALSTGGWETLSDTLSEAVGITITGAADNDLSGYSVSGAGDLNGDGKADVIIGAPQAATAVGKSYIIYGSASLSNIDLSTLCSQNGVTITGIASGDQSGWSVNNAGDINNDGRPDTIIGAPNANTNDGESYVIFG